MAKKVEFYKKSLLKEMWKNGSSVKYTIKCDKKVIETYIPFLAVKSLFFKDMFESTTQNFVEITDFQFEVLQKMIEFCETDDIKGVNGYECELFKAAHKYQMNDLMDFVVEKMSEDADDSNIFSYLQLAKKYELKEFEKWCMKFAFRTM
uniref:BTB domain-containing protein n=1 Tax=Panagrolaimus davidi TaxID=227884 RepID=A0A914QVW6_9BILA